MTYSRLLSLTTISILLFSIFCSTGTEKNCLEDSITGAIMGVAMDDALGRVTEFMDSTKTIKKMYGSPDITSFKSFKDHDWVIDPHTKQRIAAYTDDTVMSLIILDKAAKARSIRSRCSTFFNEIAAKYVTLFGPDCYKADPLYDIRAHGPTNRNACVGLGLKPLRKNSVIGN